MKVVGATGAASHVAVCAEPSVGIHIPDSSAPAKVSEEGALINLKNKLSLDGQRETLASNVLSAYHKIGMAIISNMKC